MDRLKISRLQSFDMEEVSSLSLVKEDDRNTKKVKIRDGEILDRMTVDVEDHDAVGMEGVETGTEQSGIRKESHLEVL